MLTPQGGFHWSVIFSLQKPLAARAEAAHGVFRPVLLLLLGASQVTPIGATPLCSQATMLSGMQRNPDMTQSQ